MSFLRTAVPVLLVATLSAAPSSRAQAPAPPAVQKTEADLKAEDIKANDFFVKQDFVDAFPLYQELNRLRPDSLVYEERYAMCLLATSPTGDAAARQRVKAILLDAQKKGDNSNLLQILLEKISQSENAAPTQHPAGYEFFQQAEAAFTKGDLPAAVKLYAKALEVNPQYYAAATFAGDAEFKQHHYAEAGSWFAKAVAIDPDIETAHRYWGDSLETAGDHSAARDQFIQAIIADPYSRAPRVGLKQWADRNHMMLAAPPIQVPQRAKPDAKGNININVDPSMLMNPSGMVWIVYLSSPAVWQKSEFAKHYPNEKTYRHSLAEEAESIRSVLALAKERKVDLTKDKTLQQLQELDSNGFLEAWILLDHPDQGIAQDYIAYRKEHRDLLAQYIAKYDLHPM